ncbi:MAG: TetR/AcrR family transcriptional regulator [Fibrobacteraceae bacterium]
MTTDNNFHEFTKAEPRWQRKKEERPQEILSAALELFVQQGFSATKVEQVARKAGVTPGTLYVYFENKEALLKAVVKEGLGPILSFGNKFLDEYTGTPEDLVYQLVNQWWALMESEHVAGLPKLMTAESSNFPELAHFYIEEVLTHALDMIRRILRYGIERGAFKIDDVDMMSRVIMSSLHEPTVNAHSFAIFDKEKMDMQKYLNQLTRLILKGIT